MCMLKGSFNTDLDEQASIQEQEGSAALLIEQNEEPKEGKNAFRENVGHASPNTQNSHDKIGIYEKLRTLMLDFNQH